MEDRLEKGRIHILKIFVIFIVTVNAFMVFYAPQPLLPLFVESFQVSMATASLTISVTIIGIVIASLLFANLLDRWGRKKVIMLSTLLLAIPSFVIFFSTSFPNLLFWRLIQGFLIAGITSTIMAYTSEEFPPKDKGKALGTYVSATVTGGLIGRLIAGPVAENLDWHYTFLLMALFSVLVTIIIYFFLPTSEHQAKKSEKSFFVHFCNPALIGTFFIGFSQFFAFIAFFNYLSFYAHGAPFYLSVTQISLIYLTYIFGILSAPITGFFSDRVGSRRTMATGHLIGAGGILISLWPSTGALLLGASVLALGNFASQSAVASHITNIVEESKGAATALYNAFYYTGGSLGAWLPGILWSTYQWNGVVFLTISSIFLALCSNAILVGKKQQESLHVTNR